MDAGAPPGAGWDGVYVTAPTAVRSTGVQAGWGAEASNRFTRSAGATVASTTSADSLTVTVVPANANPVTVGPPAPGGGRPTPANTSASSSSSTHVGTWLRRT